MMVMAFAATMFATIPGNTRLIPALGFVALDYRLIDKNVAKFLDWYMEWKIDSGIDQMKNPKNSNSSNF